jgi:hypothetical protein
MSGVDLVWSFPYETTNPVTIVIQSYTPEVQFFDRTCARRKLYGMNAERNEIIVLPLPHPSPTLLPLLYEEWESRVC